MTRTVLLGDIGRVVTGKTPPKANPEYWGVELDFITPTDFKDSRYILPARKLSETGQQAMRRIVCPANSVIVTCIGSDMGKVALAKNSFVSNQQINALIVDPEKAKPEFIYYLLKMNRPLLRKYAESSGSTMPIINKSTFEKLSFAIPDLETQKKIADILGTIDEKIELNRRMNETLEQMGQALFRHYFIDNPEAEKVDLSKLVVRLSNRVGKRSLDEFVVLSAVKTGDLVASEEYFTKQVFSKNISNYKQVKLHQFAYNPARVNIGSIGMLKRDINGAVSPVYEVFETKDGYHNAINELLKQPTTKKRISDLCSGTVRQILRFEDFCRIQSYKIPDQLMNKFNAQYDQAQEHIRHNSQQIQTLTTLRDTLLPRLISGKIKV